MTGSTFLLWVALGALLAPTARRVEVSPPKRGSAPERGRRRCCSPWASASQFVPLAADHAYVQAQTTPRRLQARTEAARRAARLNPFSSEYRAAVGLAYVAEVRAAFEAGRKAHEAGEDATPYAAAMREKAALAETAFRDAIAFSPDEIDHYVMLADLFNLAGETLDEGLYDDAISVAREGIARALPTMRSSGSSSPALFSRRARRLRPCESSSTPWTWTPPTGRPPCCWLPRTSDWVVARTRWRS